jgi:glyoxylase-like metal-dependent hydrolase (beta-lactamase superfamily II)
MNLAAHRVVTIDCLYMQQNFAASYLRIGGHGASAEAAFIETGTAASVPRLLEALQREGLDRGQVRWIILTHAHLDHAAGAGALAAELPNATVLAHPKAARHLIDPTRLEASARKVYGDAPFEMLYGRKLIAIPASRVRSVEDNEEVGLGGARLRFLHTRGHASHHCCIHDPMLSTVFTGDSFGLRYPALQKGGIFVFPSTSPTDFDGPEALATLERVVSCGVRSFFPTHYGEVREVVEATIQLKGDLEFSMEVLDEAIRRGEEGDLDEFCRGRIFGHYDRRMEQEGLKFGATEWALLSMDLKLNAAGIAHMARKCRVE